MDRESKEREAELKQAAEREAYIEREEEKKAKANGDFSKTAIARMKGRVQFGSRRTRRHPPWLIHTVLELIAAQATNLRFPSHFSRNQNPLMMTWRRHWG